ncbi:MATE family efflux transporter [uncultured Ilyobacter sp.]|uniref:MATE family efflux transporter n=1 Tax=uncultured Ilyobacter sp. TaxID=544433 RepID=UPI0029C0296E|nr:MATE family efflux transporter [uncultured Ilyobacter sp.]
MKKVNRLTEGPISRQLILLALPIMGSSFLQMAYGLVDMLWIGRLGSNAVAAIGTAMFFINFGYALNSMVVTGTAIKVSHSIGSKNYEDAADCIKNAFLVNFIMFFCFISGLIFFRDNLIGYFQLNNSEVESMAKTYLVITAFGLIFKFLNFLFTRILNSFGESKLPFKINAVGVVMNIILDPLLIFGLDMGVAGAALATIISQAVNMILFIRASREYFSIKNIFQYNLKKIKEILSLGLPISVQRILFTGFGILIAKIIANWGPDAIAAQKIGLQIESIAYMTAGGLYGAVASFIGQNYGAKKYKRISKGFKTAFLLSAIIGGAATFIFLVFPEELIKLFVRDRKTIEIGVSYLRIVGLSQFFMCIEIISNAAFSGIGKPKVASTVSIIFTGMRIPIAYFLSHESRMGINGVWVSIALTSIFKGIILLWLFMRSLRKIYKKVEGEGLWT